MNKFRFTINALAVVIFTLAFASLANAQATRTWSTKGVVRQYQPLQPHGPLQNHAGSARSPRPPPAEKLMA